ncbi:hypothetical protein ABZU75_36160 [Streptosporangium sp. NPDC005286]|uniref:hypothetical protein n=1 Tax=Streptosporangium sp. NPDC005286 TaxID=3154463 RepID=UPI0033B1772A
MTLEGGGWMVGDNLVADISGGRLPGYVRSGSTEALGTATITARIMSPPTCFRPWRFCTASGDRAAMPQPGEECRTAASYSNTVLRDHIPHRIHRLTRARFLRPGTCRSLVMKCSGRRCRSGPGTCVVVLLPCRREGRNDQPDGGGSDHDCDGEILRPSGDRVLRLFADQASS